MDGRVLTPTSLEVRSDLTRTSSAINITNQEEKIDWTKINKVTFVIEKTETSIKTKRIDDWKDGSQTQSTILQNKDGITLTFN